MTDTERARELLAAELERSALQDWASAIRSGATRDAMDRAAIRALTTALSAQASAEAERDAAILRALDAEAVLRDVMDGIGGMTVPHGHPLLAATDRAHAALAKGKQ